MNNKEEKKWWQLVALGEKSQLKIDLNRGVASLKEAERSFHRPHLCLNGLDGMRVIDQIVQCPDSADTYFSISEEIIYSGGADIWLNVRFSVFLGQLSSNSRVGLTPRQTSFVVLGLPDASKQAVVQKVKDWYDKYFSRQIRKALKTITAQVSEGDLLLASDHGNRVFDIHDKPGAARGDWDVPYVEWRIAGEELFSTFYHGPTLFQHGQDGYDKMDQMLATADRQRNTAVDSVLTLARGLRASGELG